MRKMRVAVGSLVDRATLGRRLLEAAAEVLRLEWGAIYLAEAPRRAAPAGRLPRARRPTSGCSPPTTRWSSGSAGRRRSGCRTPMALAGASDPATDAMIALGGEVANALEADGDLAGLLVLGPKRSGMPYEDEEIAFLGALSSVADPGPALGGHPADARSRSTRSCATRSRRSPSSSGGS